MSTIEQMVNEDYGPNDREEKILNVLEEGRATPKYIKERTSHTLNDQQINYAMNQLIAAGWVRKVTTGLYELRTDPRGDNDS